MLTPSASGFLNRLDIVIDQESWRSLLNGMRNLKTFEKRSHDG